MVLLVVTADNHLGQYAARMPFARLEERRRRLREGFRRAVSYAVQHRAAAFLHAGDLFDTVDPRNLERVMVSRELRRLRDTGIAVVGIGGNHDTPRHTGQHGGYHAADIYASLGGLHFCAESGEVTSVVIERDGLTIQFGGVSWDPTLDPDDDPLDGLSYP
ncbi:MAG: metallophosphoesterase, partial [Chloroflexota bacterium]|nr:metallophosphoesterase [Chloroflexota bacterium]